MLSQNSPESGDGQQRPTGQGNAFDHAFPPAPLWEKQPPHADPAGRFRPAPFAMGARIRYFVAIAAAVIVMLALPVAINSQLPEAPQPAFASSEEAFENDLTTFRTWPLTFSALDDCEVLDSADALRTPKFYCDPELHNAKITVVGMNDVANQKLAVDRGIRVLNGVEVQSMKPQRWTAHAEEVDPELKQRTGTTDVWLTGYYQFDYDVETPEYLLSEETLDSPDPFHELTLHRTVSFYRDGEDGPGTMVTLEVTAKGVDSHREILAALIKSADLAEEAEDTEPAGKEEEAEE